jgi:hypothetical protein
LASNIRGVEKIQEKVNTKQWCLIFTIMTN